ncbi:hypothetical protein Trydic_g2067 [Trypoxylus dichotomus]
MLDFPVKCEMQYVIRFLEAKGNDIAEIHHRNGRVYNTNFVNDAVVADQNGSGSKSVAGEDLIQRGGQGVRERRGFSISICGIFGNHKTRRTASVLIFPTRYVEEFLESILARDKTWILYDHPQSDEQSKQ